MDVPKDIQNCVAFLGYKLPNSLAVKLGGTGFFVYEKLIHGSPNAQYLVTAKHVIRAIKDKLGTDQKILVQVNRNGSPPTIIETSYNEWIEHPNATVDVAVRPFDNTPIDLDHSFISVESFALEHILAVANIHVGQEIFITGLFVPHTGHERNIPIVRVGTIAAMTGEKIHVKGWGDVEAYLVELRSISGLSGSPVFASTSGPMGLSSSSAAYSVIASQLEPGKGFCLMGLLLGHLNSGGDLNDSVQSNSPNDRINTGIGIVVPVGKIQEVLNQPVFVTHRQEMIDKYRSAHGPSSV